MANVNSPWHRPRNTGRFRYQVIADELSRAIAAGDYPTGGMLPSENALAASFGVNRLTVRKALELLQEDGRIDRQQGKGTTVCVPPASTKVGNLLYVGPLHAHLWNRIAVALQRRTQVGAFRLTSLEPPSPADTAWSEALSRAVAHAAGVVVAADAYGGTAPVLREYGSPTVIVGDNMPAGVGTETGVLTDQARAVELAVSHLAELGHRRILLVSAHVTLPPRRVGERGPGPLPDRLCQYYPAYRAALARHCIDDYEGVLHCDGATDAPQVARVSAFLADPVSRPTAVVCQADNRARTIYAAAAALGLTIPGDLSIVGINDTPWAPAMVPALTSVNVGEARIGRLAVDLLARGLPPDGLVCRVNPTLVERDSTAPPERTVP